jgi:DnaJ-class molecular chaperone
MFGYPLPGREYTVKCWRCSGKGSRRIHRKRRQCTLCGGSGLMPRSIAFKRGRIEYP